MGISLSDGLHIAERQAWAKTGEKHRWWFTWGKRVVPLALIAGALGALGYGIHRAWQWATGALGDLSAPTVPAAGGVPRALWIATVILIAATALAVRHNSRAVRFAPVAVTGIALVLAWTGLAAYAFGTLA